MKVDLVNVTFSDIRILKKVRQWPLMGHGIWMSTRAQRFFFFFDAHNAYFLSNVIM